MTGEETGRMPEGRQKAAEEQEQGESCSDRLEDGTGTVQEHKEDRGGR